MIDEYLLKKRGVPQRLENSRQFFRVQPVVRRGPISEAHPERAVRLRSNLNYIPRHARLLSRQQSNLLQLPPLPRTDPVLLTLRSASNQHSPVKGCPCCRYAIEA